MQQPERTVRRWLQRWLALGVEGIAAIPARGRYGVQYRVSATLLARWRAGDLPEPRALPVDC